MVWSPHAFATFWWVYWSSIYYLYHGHSGFAWYICPSLRACGPRAWAYISSKSFVAMVRITITYITLFTCAVPNPQHKQLYHFKQGATPLLEINQYHPASVPPWFICYTRILSTEHTSTWAAVSFNATLINTRGSCTCIYQPALKQKFLRDQIWHRFSDIEQCMTSHLITLVFNETNHWPSWD